MTQEDRLEITRLFEAAVERALAPVVAQMRDLMARLDDDPFTPEEEAEILERMRSNEPGIPHDEAMRQVFGK